MVGKVKAKDKTSSDVDANALEKEPERATVEVFYDGRCPVCRREIDFLRRRDRNRRLSLIDFAAPGFDPAQYGFTWQDLVSRMYVRDEKGVWREGLDSFPVIWGAVGMGRWWRWTRTPGLRHLGMAGYAVFRRVRPRFSGFRPCPIEGFDPKVGPVAEPANDSRRDKISSV